MRFAVMCIGLLVNLFPAHAGEAETSKLVFTKGTVNDRTVYIVPEGMTAEVKGWLAGDFIDYPHLTGFWTPTIENVSTAEKAVHEFISHAKTKPLTAFPQWVKAEPRVIENAQNEITLVDKNYAKYKIQFVGVLIKEKKIIYCNYLDFGPEPSVNLPDPATQIIDVNDGGHYFWQVEYDMASGKCLNLQINGPWQHDW